MINETVLAKTYPLNARKSVTLVDEKKYPSYFQSCSNRLPFFAQKLSIAHASLPKKVSVVKKS